MFVSLLVADRWELNCSLRKWLLEQALCAAQHKSGDVKTCSAERNAKPSSGDSMSDSGLRLAVTTALGPLAPSYNWIPRLITHTQRKLSTFILCFSTRM